MTALAMNSVGEAEEKLAWIFSSYDIDNNGFIDKEELKKMLKV